MIALISFFSFNMKLFSVTCDKAGHTPLSIAAFAGRLEVVKALIIGGASIEIADKVIMTGRNCIIIDVTIPSQ